MKEDTRIQKLCDACIVSKRGFAECVTLDEPLAGECACCMGGVVGEVLGGALRHHFKVQD